MHDSPRFALGLRHLLLFIAGVSIGLALNRLIREMTVELPPVFDTVNMLYGYALAVTHGVGVAALLAWITRLEARTGQFPTEPGHWILIADGLANVVGLAAFVVAMKLMLPQGKGYAQYYALFIHQVAVTPCSVAIFAWALSSSVLPKRWQAWFCLVATGQLILGLWSAPLFFINRPFDYIRLLPTQVSPCVATLNAIVLVVVVLLDRRAGEQRDWLHWTAITISLLEWAIYLAWYVVMLYW
jgi:hypothetical protein